MGRDEGDREERDRDRGDRDRDRGDKDRKDKGEDRKDKGEDRKDKGEDRKDKDRDRDRDGGKEKKEKKKRRSASSESADKSREREKRRRKQQATFANKNKAAPAGGAPGAPAAGQSMFWDGFQWVPRADTGVNANDPNSSRKNRRLYLGNLPYHLGITEDSYSKQLYETMRDRGMCNDPNQNPVLHVWFARDKGANYGFCEVATLEETERALQLDGMMCLGVPVSIKRPNDAASPMGMIGGVPVGMQAQPGGMLALPAMQVSATSPIIMIDQILKVDDKTTKDDYQDVQDDMSEGCGAHGKVLGVLIIRPEHASAHPGLKPGDVYLRCATTDDATKVMRAMGHRKYDGRQIMMKSFEEGKFNSEIKPLM